MHVSSGQKPNEKPHPARDTGGQASGSPSDEHERRYPPLSPTERRVYDLLLQRMTERQVAERLERSHNTVHVHVRNIYRKLGVRTRQELLGLPYQAQKAVRRQGSKLT